MALLDRIRQLLGTSRDDTPPVRSRTSVDAARSILRSGSTGRAAPPPRRAAPAKPARQERAAAAPAGGGPDDALARRLADREWEAAEHEARRLEAHAELMEDQHRATYAIGREKFHGHAEEARSSERTVDEARAKAAKARARADTLRRKLGT